MRFQSAYGPTTQIQNSNWLKTKSIKVWSAFLLCIPYGNPVHFDQKWTHTGSPAEPEWLGLVGIEIALFNAGMQTCGEIWPGLRESSSPASLYVNKAATARVTTGLIHPGPRFHDTCTTNWSRGVSVKWWPVDSVMLNAPPLLSSCIGSHEEVAALRENPGFDTSVTLHEVTSSDMSIPMTSTSCMRAQIYTQTSGWSP